MNSAVDERSPLLREASHQEEASSYPQAEPTTLLNEVTYLIKATIPISASFLLQNVVQALSIIICGSLGPRKLDIASYGYMFATCTGSMVSIGGATALDTLCGQAMTSSKARKQPTVLGQHLQQTLVVLSALYIVFITPIWLFSGRIFLALGQQRDFALGTGQFLIFMLPAGYAQMVVECFKKYAQVQGSSYAVGWAVFASAIVGVGANLVLVRHTDLGVNGASLAFLIYQTSSLILLALIVARRERQKKTLQLLSSWSELFDGLRTNAFLCVTGLLTIATEWWSFEILAMMAARLRPTEISAQSIIMSADLIFTTISLGIGVATSHRIGQFLGANNVSNSRLAALAPYILSLILGIVEFVLIMAFRSQFGYLFTSDPDVVAATATVLPAMAVFQILDLSNGGAGGVLRGARRNHISGMCNALAYYGVGITLAWALCFKMGWGLVGLWIGIISGSGALLVLQTTFVLILPWRKVALEASGEEE